MQRRARAHERSAVCVKHRVVARTFDEAEDDMGLAMVGGGLAASICAIAVGSGLIMPMGVTIGGLFDIVGVAGAMVCLGLLEGT